MRPESFIPVHGTRMHLQRHAELASMEGVEDTLVVENGAVVEITTDEMCVVDDAKVGRIAVDRMREIPDEVLHERALLSELGCAFAIIPLDESDRFRGEVTVIARGVVGEEEEEQLLGDAERYVEAELSEASKRGGRVDRDATEERAGRALKRFLGRRLGRKPLTWAVTTRVEDERR